MATVNEVFQTAPIGRRVILASAFALGALLLVFAVNLYVALARIQHAPPGARMLQALLPLIPIAFVAASFMWERSKGSRISIEDNTLVIRKKRYALQGLTDAARDRLVLRGARKIWGNGGVGSIRGRFKSKRLGKFEAYLTDTENAVVLTWPDKVVAVSPADPEFFMYCARSAAGMR
jgi:hypothetical protein